MRRRKLVVLAEAAVRGRRPGKRCAVLACGVVLEAGEAVVCDRCWALELEARIALGEKRWGEDLERARLRIAARGKA